MTEDNFTPSRHDIGELKIIISLGLSFCMYVGTRAHLDAEGVIPVGTKWPDGFSWVSWEANGLRFRLVRERPEGAKGPRRVFLDCDNWCLRMDVQGRSVADAVIKHKADNLAQYIHGQTPAGQAEFFRQCELYYAACNDEKFQAFKALIPGLIPPSRKRRGHPSNASATQSQEAV